MTGPRSPIYNTRGHAEDLLAILSSMLDHQKCIITHAYYGGSMGAIFSEAAQTTRDIQRARRIIQEHWCEIQAVIEAAKD